MKIQTFQIRVNAGRRETDPEAVHKLADSISKVGLLNPITVDQEYTLIAGLHRLEAAKLLGWTEIECSVSSLDGLLAELAEIDENIIRRELDCVDEGEQLSRRKEIYEMLHPETKNGGNRRHDTTRTSKCRSGETKPFVQDAAEKLGVGRRTIERAIEMAKNLTPEAKEIIRGSDRKVTKANAQKLSRLAPEQQKDAAIQLVTGIIRSIDEYSTVPTEPESAPPKTEKPQNTVLPEPPLMIPATSSPTSDERCYATVKESVEDLKDPDKDRSRTPDTFLTSFSYFLRRFCQTAKTYVDAEYETAFPALTQEHLDQIHYEICCAHTVLDELFNEIERKVHK